MIRVACPSSPMRMTPLGVKPSAAPAAAARPINGDRPKLSSRPPPTAALACRKPRRVAVDSGAESLGRWPASANRSRRMVDLPSLRWLGERRLLDRGTDARISAAAADVAVHCIVYVGVAGAGIFGEKRGSRHNLAGLAIAALHDLQVEPCLLHGLSGRRFTDRLDGGDGRATHTVDRRDARPRRHAIDVHGAGAAGALATDQLALDECDAQTAL